MRLKIAGKVATAALVAWAGLNFAYAQESDLKAGSLRKDAHGVEQVYVPAGCFKMGSDDPTGYAGLERPSWAGRAKGLEQPAHEVCLTKGYWIDKTEVTNASFAEFKADGGYDKEALWSAAGWKWVSKLSYRKSLPFKCDNRPADFPRICITWYEAEAYANWRGGRLPTEAEWEFAARGPESLIFPWGNEWDPAKTNIVDAKDLLPVGSLPDGASWVGALDMSGNAMEWVADWLSGDYYAQSPQDDPTGPETGEIKVEKGGWWGSLPYVGRSAYRHYEDPPDYQDKHIGVRIVTDVAAK